MNPRMKIPGPDHPITVAPNPKRVRVSIGGDVIAETTRALRSASTCHRHPSRFAARAARTSG